MQYNTTTFTLGYNGNVVVLNDLIFIKYISLWYEKLCETMLDAVVPSPSVTKFTLAVAASERLNEIITENWWKVFYFYLWFQYVI